MSRERRSVTRWRHWGVSCLGLLMALSVMRCQHTPVAVTALEPSPPVTPEPSPVRASPFVIEADPALTRWATQIPDEPVAVSRSRRAPAAAVTSSPRRRGRPAIEAAIRQATIQPSDGDFQGGMAQLPYVEGAVYHLDVGLDAPLLVMFPAGEEVLQWGGLDRARWLVKEPVERVVGDPTVFMFVAFEANTCGRYTFVTTRGRYLLSLCSDVRPGLPAVTWTHPTVEEPTRTGGLFPVPGLYRVGYAWATPKGQAPPVWNPLWIGDSAERGKTLILFPRERLTTAAPILLVHGPGGTRQVTNGRGRGQWYEVDRQFLSAELRVGHDEHAEVVSIAQRALRWVRCPGDPGCYPPDTLTDHPR